MVRVSNKPKLSIVIPTLNEAKALPLLLADLASVDDDIELIIVDGGSKDLTRFIAEIAGAKVLLNDKPGRGSQLRNGSLQAEGEWLLFIHADSRLPLNSIKYLSQFINSKQSKNCAYFFNFRIKNKGMIYRLLELAVFIRSNLFKTPYGDQGLLISKELYLFAGGYKDLYIMEDLEFILRLSLVAKVRCLGINLITDGKRWNKGEVIKNAINNAKLRHRWVKGESSEFLYKKYYSENKKR